MSVKVGQRSLLFLSHLHHEELAHKTRSDFIANQRKLEHGDLVCDLVKTATPCLKGRFSGNIIGFF